MSRSGDIIANNACKCCASLVLGRAEVAAMADYRVKTPGKRREKSTA
jgi:hypothetical protein